MANILETEIDSEVGTILRVANEIEPASPFVAHICRFHAFEKALKIDPTSTGIGVHQFKMVLLQRLRRDAKTALSARKRENDTREVQSFYWNYVQQLAQRSGQADRAELTKASETTYVLLEVLEAVTKREAAEFAPEILTAGKDVKEKTEMLFPYNILPLDPASEHQAIMQLPEINAVVKALLNTRGLKWPGDNQKPDIDLLDWVQATFGFQKDNVANQREHLILLLANVHIRKIRRPMPEQMSQLGDEALNEVMKKLFQNYRQWCKYIGCKSSLWLSITQQDVHQSKLLFMGLYLLIWGEAANLQFMPECLCYIYHHKTVRGQGHQQIWTAKTDFVEIRSYWHLFKSFDRMWTFFYIGSTGNDNYIMAWYRLPNRNILWICP